MSRNRKHRRQKPVRFRGPGDARQDLRRSASAGFLRPDRNNWPAIIAHARLRAGRNRETQRVIDHAVRLAGLYPATAMVPTTETPRS